MTGEYLVLDGALALAVPTKKGQDLVVKEISEHKVFWKSYDENGKVWLERTFHFPITIRKSDPKIIQTLKHIFLQIRQLNPDFFNGSQGYEVTTHLEFPRKWGLGSSSTLIYNLATWAHVNPYELLANTMGGSGYDLACAGSNTPLYYQLQNQKSIVTPVHFSPDFADQLFFIHLNQKQRSSREIKRYKSLTVTDKKEVIHLVSEISELMLKVNCIDDFALLMNEHEKLLASVLKRNPIQTHFKDYFGQLKSLGAWGGDFIMATGNEDTPEYFKRKGFETVLSFREMVL